ncbi:MAG TPA: hypothetical protein VFC71_11850 [Candidatus Polarisedimenticolia bacterium]|nr:hypothetical protein [Candidatus Polarisedimenticolia bacterium]
MNDDRVFERAIDDWLSEGSDETPRPAVDAVLLAVRTTPQERDLRFPRRTSAMPIQVRLAAVIAVIAIGGLAAMTIFRPAPGPGHTTPEPSPTATAVPSPTPSPTPNVLLDTTTWTPYTSAQYGFKIGHPSDWSVEPAERAWDLETDAADPMSSAADAFYTSGAADGLGVRVSIWSVPFEYVDGETWEQVEAWLETYCEAAGGGTRCTPTHDRAVRLCIEIYDCHPGLLLASSDWDTQAFFSGGYYNGEMVVVSIWRTDNDPSVAPYGGGRRLLEAFLSTMCVWPEDARPRSTAAGCLASG